MLQVGRNLTDSKDGFLRGKRYLLMDRDKKYSDAFRSMLKGSDVEPVRLPPKSPNLNAHIERFARSIKEDCLERLILFGEDSLRNALVAF
jgi:putative transposase